MSVSELLVDQPKLWANLVVNSEKLTGLSNQLVFAPADGVNSSTFTTAPLTAPRTITIPDESGTLLIGEFPSFESSHAQMYFANGSPIVTPGVGTIIPFIQPPALTTLTQNTADWSMPSVGVLQYSGTSSRRFKISWAMSAEFATATGTAGVNDWNFGLIYNGIFATYVTGSQINNIFYGPTPASTTLPTPPNTVRAFQSLASSYIIVMNPSDTITLGCNNTGIGGAVVAGVQSMQPLQYEFNVLNTDL